MAKRPKIRTGAPDEGKAPEKLQINEKQLLLPLQHEAMLTATDVINILGGTPPAEPEVLNYSVSTDGHLRLLLFDRKSRDSARFEEEAARRAGMTHRGRHLNLREILTREFGWFETA
jgi:hypothetical protein